MLSWLSVAEWLSYISRSVTFGLINIPCKVTTCFGLLAVYRLGLALSVFHISIAFIIIVTKSSVSRSLAIHNDYWKAKLSLWIILIIAIFSIPDAVSQFWGAYIAPIGSTMFLMFGLMITIDIAHTWVESALNHIEQAESYVWQAGLILTTIICYSLCITLTITMYIVFAREGCIMNQYGVTVSPLYFV